MNWSDLQADPLWEEFWASKEVLELRLGVENQLRNGANHDPHTIGRLRGQLAMFDRLQTLAEQNAKREQQENESLSARKPTNPEPWMRFVQRIR